MALRQTRRGCSILGTAASPVRSTRCRSKMRARGSADARLSPLTVDHVRYGLELMNRWASGEENPFATANYSQSWQRQSVNEEEWRNLREALARELQSWERAVREPRDLDGTGLTGMIASVVHLAYHLGAIRQLNGAIAGPRAKD
jgi:hypothetical protein